MKANPVSWFEIYVQDMARSQKFYESVLRATLEPLGDPNDDTIEMRAFPMEMQSAGASGALVKMKDVPSGGNSTLVYFDCDDCSEEASRVLPAGGRIQREKMAIGAYGFIVLAFDTEGNLFGLHSMR